jgi:hypothetical protein
VDDVRLRSHEWRALMQYRLTDPEARQMTEGYGHPEVDNAPVTMLAAGEGPAKGDPRVFLGTHNLIRDESTVLCYVCEQPWTAELAARPCPGEPGAKLAYVDHQGRDLHPHEAPVPGSNIGPGLTSVGRNDPCPCGSGQKFKRCHGG